VSIDSWREIRSALYPEDIGELEEFTGVPGKAGELGEDETGDASGPDVF
jgi:hypothetical protein